MDDRALRPRSGASAKALLLTVLGELVLPHGGAIWTSTVVRAPRRCSTSRSATPARPLARLADQGTLRSEKHGRRARWHLTDAGRRLLVDGTERIYELGAGDDRWDGRWLVVLCSVPEDQRAKRHQLRTQLGSPGSGSSPPASPCRPHLDREPAANAVLAELDLLPGRWCSVPRPATSSRPDDLLARAWDLDALARRVHRLRRRVRGSPRRRPTRPASPTCRAGPRVAALPVHGSGDPGRPAARAAGRADGPRRCSPSATTPGRPAPCAGTSTPRLRSDRHDRSTTT